MQTYHLPTKELLAQGRTDLNTNWSYCCLWQKIAVFDTKWIDYTAVILLILVLIFLDGISAKMCASGTGDIGFKSWADQISHTLPMTRRHHCNHEVWALAQNRWNWNRSLDRDTRKGILCEYNKDFILFKFFRNCSLLNKYFDQWRKSWECRGCGRIT